MKNFYTEGDRLQAFSDGVIAVIITIMVLELKAPHGTDLHSLLPTVPTFLAYVLSFILVGIYWNNHHHLLRASIGVNGKVMWANLHLLFWLSLIPFTTSWVGENSAATIPTALYALVMCLAAIAYWILQQTLIEVNGRDGAFAKAIRGDAKGMASFVVSVAAVGLAFVQPRLSDVLLVALATLWFIPDRRLEPVIAVRETA